MKIKFECPRCVNHFEKEGSILNRHTLLDRSSVYQVRCPECLYLFEINGDYVEEQINNNLDMLSKGEY